MDMELTARDIMDAQVICIQADAMVKEALEFLVAPPLPSVLVLDAAGHLVGTLTMLDVMEGAEPMGGTGRTEIGAGDSGLEFYEYDSRFCEAPGKMATVRLNEMMDKTRAILGPAVMNRPAHELMSTTLISVEASAPVAHVVAMLCDRQIDRLIVVEGGKPCGLVEMAEVIAAIAGGRRAIITALATATLRRSGARRGRTSGRDGNADGHNGDIPDFRGGWAGCSGERFYPSGGGCG